MKDLLFLGPARADLKAFPTEARQAAGTQLKRVQMGLMPTDWKPTPSVGPGVIEIRLRVSVGTFRVLYAANIGEYVLVLHCFQKKSARISRVDISLATARYRAFLRGARS